MDIYQHFRKEEYNFIDQALEWCEIVKVQYSQKLSDFLDPREQEIIKLIIGKDEEIQVEFFGGHESVERKRALIYPSFFQINQEDFHLKLLEIQYPSKFIEIEHPQVLGSLMSLGLKRSKFGDILLQEGQIQIVVANEITEYIKLHLKSIGKATIRLKELPLNKIIVHFEDWDEEIVTVSSMRLDTILAHVYQISRQKTQTYIQSENVKVNWKIVNQAPFECREGDLLSVRGLGRCKILSVDGKTKKDKWRLLLGKQK